MEDILLGLLVIAALVIGYFAVDRIWDIIENGHKERKD